MDMKARRDHGHVFRKDQREKTHIKRAACSAHGGTHGKAAHSPSFETVIYVYQAAAYSYETKIVPLVTVRLWGTY